MMAVSIPVYTVKGMFTICVPQFLEHTAGIHPPDAGSEVHTSSASGQPFSSPYHPAVCCLWAFWWHFVCVSPYRTTTKHVKCFIEHVNMLRIVPGVRTHNLRAGPNNKTFYKHTYTHTYIAQISTPHCTIISLASRSAIILICSHADWFGSWRHSGGEKEGRIH